MTNTAAYPMSATPSESLHIFRVAGLHGVKAVMASVFFILMTQSVYAKPLDGRLTISGGYFASSAQLTGDMDTTAGVLQFDSSAIFGAAATFLTVELLGPGTYTRTHNVTTGGTITRTGTIPAGKSGAYFVISQNGTEYQVFNAWTVSADGLNFDVYNIPGNTLIGGALDGRRLVTAFSVPADLLSLAVDVVGGLDHECSETGGATVTANAVTTGGLALDRVEWKLDGAYQGDGLSRSFFIPLGGATLEATAYATDGVTSESKTLPVSVTDTVAPVVAIRFLDGNGAEVTTAQVGDYTVRLDVSDVCDPAPVASASAAPVMDVSDGDIITINSPTDVRLPTTAVRVSASVTDASGRSTIASKVLTIQ